jgi:hypothetical protein
MLKNALFIVFSVPLMVLAQPTWQSSPPAAPEPVEVFRATMMANLPTATMLYKGDWHYEISHRFYPPLKDGFDANFGLDGPATIRMAFGYGLSDRSTITLGRSSLLDNLDLQIKHRIWDASSPSLSNAVAVQIGLAWNTDTASMRPFVTRDRTDGANFQYYAQLIYNGLLLDGKLAVGLVPSYLYNSTIFSVETQQTFTLGTYYQLYFDDMWGLWLEYSPTLSGYQGVLQPGQTGGSHHSLASGISIETGGHVFYLFATNNTRLNPAQYLVGAPHTAAPSNWRLGFAITRYL